MAKLVFCLIFGWRSTVGFHIYRNINIKTTPKAKLQQMLDDFSNCNGFG